MKGEVQLQPPVVQQNLSDSEPLLENQEEDVSPVSSTEIKDEDLEAVHSLAVEFVLKAIPTQRMN